MRHQISQRSRKSPVIVDEDCGIPTSVIDSYREDYDAGPLGPTDPRTLLLSMSDYKQPQNFEVYDYSPATRPEQAQDYTGFAANPAYGSDYVGAQAQVPSGLPQSTGLNMMPSAHQTYGTHDPTYYSQQQSQYPAYLDSEPRQLPEVISYSPPQGQQGTKVTVHFRTTYNLDNPSTSIVMMFGQQRCSSVLSKTSHQGPPYEYALTAEAPSLSSTNSSSPQLPLHLMFEGSPSWASPSLEFGTFSFLDEFPIDSPTQQTSTQRKRKLTPDADERRSPVKKQSYAALPPSTRSDSQSYYSGVQPSISVSTDYSRSTMADAYSQARRFSVPEPAYGHNLPRVSAQQQYYGAHPASAAARLQSTQSPSYNYYSSLPNTTRSPAMQAMSAGARSSMLPTPSSGANPPLIRTSTITQSPTTPGAPSQSFNPYGMYPGNQKAQLKIDGDLNTMVDNFTPEEWEVKRRLVQFRRSQQGSVITTTFEPVSPEERAPNSICVSCIYWAEKGECYVTSVDTIQLLEALVAVRFTVEEKNRIRRNLEGFRPATVSKAKQDSEEFFKLIMGFPNPKPRNIEKDVKVFPWRILHTALKKIIGKYSASYSSTAGAMPQQMASAGGYSRGPGQMVSPLSTTAPSHAYASAMTTQSYAGGSAGFGPSAGPPDLRLTVPGAGGYQPTSHYSSSDLSAASSAGRGNSWDFGTYISASPATGLPGSAQATHYQFGIGAGQQQQQRISTISALSAQSVNEGRFLPMYDQDEASQQTSSA